ncbi:MAG: UDP-2,3-diacylglucosamine diphosphatase, partial [Bacteroidaceae bacterium]|nr:UDP-2,3-diacylglucosamine diphosphatase [Bacteroidaceae bacterium]
YWMLGNHDIWIFDYLPNEIGIKVIDGPVVHQIGSEKFYLSHGDNEGKMPKTYKIMRGIFRNKACQWLYGHINPNFTMPFALGWSNNNRTKRSPITVKTEMSNSLDNIRESLNSVSLSNPDIEYFILGHFHAIHDTKLATGKRMLVIGDWISHFSYACYNSVEKSLSINKF